MKRSTPLRRKTRIRQKRATPRRSSRIRDPEHMADVRRLPCAAQSIPEATPCQGRIEADHMGRRGIGQKCPDDETGPLCSRHHAERGSFAGMFRHWTQPKMRQWLEATILATKLYVAMLRESDTRKAA